MTTSADITPSQLNTLSKLIYSESGIVIGEKKRALLRARLAKRMRLTQKQNVSDYMTLLRQDQSEFLHFIDAVTTNHTNFFREDRHCEYLISQLNPAVPVKLWSAASSSGEEPYSIGSQLLDAGFNFSIFASDISETMLATARTGIYPKERLKQFPRPSLSRYFQRGQGKRAGSIRVKPEVQRHVTFGKFNLIADRPPGQFDVIFCRNVMIYFDTPTRQKVVDSLTTALKPGGYLFVGMSESLSGINHPLITQIPSAYRKP
jgi:chemotaxis protein methyltransferase CheR